MAEANRIKNRRLQGHGASTEEFDDSEPLAKEAPKPKEPLSAKEEKQMLRDLVHVKTDDVQAPERDKNVVYVDTVRHA